MKGGPRSRQPDFRERLREEFARRRQVNARYSLRAYAEWLDIDHSTLSQMLKGNRAVPTPWLRKWSAKLGLGEEETAIYAAAAQADDPLELETRLRTKLWIGEAQSFLNSSVHWRLLQLVRTPQWRPDIRWAARHLAVGVDELNEALSRLLRLSLLRIGSDGSWREASGLTELTEAGLKECALGRIRAAMSAR
jgi:hypothetical protein